MSHSGLWISSDVALDFNLDVQCLNACLLWGVLMMCCCSICCLSLLSCMFIEIFVYFITKPHTHKHTHTHKQTPWERAHSYAHVHVHVRVRVQELCSCIYLRNCTHAMLHIHIHACMQTHAYVYMCVQNCKICVCVCVFVLVRRKHRYNCVRNCRRRLKTIDAAGGSRIKIVQQADLEVCKSCIAKLLTRLKARVTQLCICRHIRRRAKSSIE